MTTKISDMAFEEARDFIRQKLLIPTERWNDLVGGAHSKAFTVAGATKTALLKDLYSAIQKAIDSGSNITKFRKEFDDIVSKHGWSYNGKRGWRTSVIFRTNKRTAYMAGRWSQAWRLKEARPYLQYLTVGDERVRESHELHNKKVFRIDDPFWRTHYPPNGWLCRCTVRTLSQDDLDDENLSVSEGPRPKPIERVDPATGEIMKGHEGIDIGWDHNVGANWLAPDILLGRELVSLPSQLRTSSLNMANNSVYDLPFKQLVSEVADEMLRKQSKNKGRGVTVGFLSSNTVDFLISKGKVPHGATIIARDKDIWHWLRESKANTPKSLPYSIATQVPIIYREPSVILFDSNDNSLIFAKSIGEDKYAKFIVHLDFKTKLNQAKLRFNDHLNIVKSAGITSAINLIGPNLEIISGSIER